MIMKIFLLSYIAEANFLQVWALVRDKKQGRGRYFFLGGGGIVYKLVHKNCVLL